MRSSVTGLVLGWLADQWIGDPEHLRLPDLVGEAGDRLERITYADTRANGIVHATVLVGSSIAAGLALDRLTMRRPILRAVATAGCTWVALDGRRVLRRVDAVHPRLIDGRIDEIRGQVGELGERDVEELDADDLAGVCVEALARDTADDVVGPMFWGSVAGMPGLLGYRAIHSLHDRMSRTDRGASTPRYRDFGWAVARLHHLSRWLPARLGGTAAAVAAPIVGGSTTPAMHTMIVEGARQSDPDAGIIEAAFAGALHIRIGAQTYRPAPDHPDQASTDQASTGQPVTGTAGRPDEDGDRIRTGTGLPVGVSDLPRARRLAWYTMVGGLVTGLVARALTVGPRPTTD